MITKLTVESFKTLEKVDDIELGLVNVFIGANGSGKSNLLEAVGLLSAAADGKVDDQVLLQRGVRPGLPQLYKSAFNERLPQHIYFAARSEKANFEVALLNPLEAKRPWRFKHELLMDGNEKISSRLPSMRNNPNTERGLAAHAADSLPSDSPARQLMRQLQEFVIYSPSTSVLRGTDPESAPRLPVGLHGGRLPEAVHELLGSRGKSAHAKQVCREALSLIDWARKYGSAAAATMPLSPAASASPRVIRFVDRYMREGRNVLRKHSRRAASIHSARRNTNQLQPEFPENRYSSARSNFPAPSTAIPRGG
jgi:energy-coupling factor transporter ATP-binding protein EcfA2